MWRESEWPMASGGSEGDRTHRYTSVRVGFRCGPTPSETPWQTTRATPPWLRPIQARSTHGHPTRLRPSFLRLETAMTGEFMQESTRHVSNFVNAAASIWGNCPESGSQRRLPPPTSWTLEFTSPIPRGDHGERAKGPEAEDSAVPAQSRSRLSM